MLQITMMQEPCKMNNTVTSLLFRKSTHKHEHSTSILLMSRINHKCTRYYKPLVKNRLLLDYIEIKRTFGKSTRIDFEKNLYKLINDTIFDKMKRNVSNRVDVRLVTK